MGFNKRYISSQKLKSFINNGCSVSMIFNVDALFFMDEKSKDVYEKYLQGVDENKLKKLITNDTN